MNGKNDPIKLSRFRIYAVLILMIGGLVFTGPGAADTMAAGVQAGAVHACPTPCSCMPQSQAERLGYILCSGNQSPCFHDSRDQPLYCYKPSSVTCQPGSGCGDATIARVPNNGSNEIPSVGTAGVPESTLVSNCSTNESGSCTVLGATGTGAGSLAGDIFSILAGFFRSLFGMT